MPSIVIFTILMLWGLSSQAHASGDFTLSSPNIKPGGTLPMDQVFNGFGCAGRNISPRLEWKNPPAGTKSYAIMVYDPDAPSGSGWWHWIVFDIPAHMSALELNAGNPAANKMPEGIIQSLTDFGSPGYGGACPPPGDKPHRYVFTIYALKTPVLGLDAKAMPAMVGFNIRDKILGKASFTATFGR